MSGSRTILSWSRHDGRRVERPREAGIQGNADFSWKITGEPRPVLTVTITKFPEVAPMAFHPEREGDSLTLNNLQGTYKSVFRLVK